MCVCVCVRVCMRVCLCVCARTRERRVTAAAVDDELCRTSVKRHDAHIIQARMVCVCVCTCVCV